MRTSMFVARPVRFRVAISGSKEIRQLQGIPTNWNTVEYWLSNEAVPYPVQKLAPKPELKWPNIPALSSYREAPSEDFWERFPKRDLPLAPATTVNKPALKEQCHEIF